MAVHGTTQKSLPGDEATASWRTHAKRVSSAIRIGNDANGDTKFANLKPMYAFVNMPLLTKNFPE